MGNLFFWSGCGRKESESEGSADPTNLNPSPLARPMSWPLDLRLRRRDCRACPWLFWYAKHFGSYFSAVLEWGRRRPAQFLVSLALPVRPVTPWCAGPGSECKHPSPSHLCESGWSRRAAALARQPVTRDSESAQLASGLEPGRDRAKTPTDSDGPATSKPQYVQHMINRCLLDSVTQLHPNYRCSLGSGELRNRAPWHRKHVTGGELHRDWHWHSLSEPHRKLPSPNPNLKDQHQGFW